MRPRLKFDGRNELLIDYLEQTVALTLKSDQGPACTNTVEAVYLVSVIFSIVTGIGIVRKILSILILLKILIWNHLFGIIEMNNQSFLDIFIERKETYYGG